MENDCLHLSLFEYRVTSSSLHPSHSKKRIEFNEELELWNPRVHKNCCLAFCVVLLLRGRVKRVNGIHVVIATCYKLYMFIMCKNVISDRV